MPSEARLDFKIHLCGHRAIGESTMSPPAFQTRTASEHPSRYREKRDEEIG